MKNPLVALAALAVAGAATAQSSLTLFGVVDLGVAGFSSKATNAAGNTVKATKTALYSGGINGSRLGFRGTEDLGGGLAAGFWLEAGMAADTGVVGGTTAGGNSYFNRRSTVSLSGPFGEVRLGRDYTPTYWNDGVFDPFGNAGITYNVITLVNAGLFTVAGAKTPLGAGGLNSDPYARSNHSISYFLPSNLGGFYGEVQYAFPGNTRVTGSTSPAIGREIGGRFGYAKGPLDVALAYGRTTMDGGFGAGVSTYRAWSNNKIDTLNLGMSYDFGVVKLFGELSQVQQKLSNKGSLGNTGKDKYNGWLVGATVPVGAGLILTSYSHVRASTSNSLTWGSPAARVGQWALGYEYNLSRRTALYALLAGQNLKGAQNNVAISTVNTGVAYAAGGTPKSSMAYNLGMRHTF
ncbi:MAG: porin [Gammaproteobacteria bacterium]